MKMKRFIVLGALTLCIALMSGVSYAWFKDQAAADITNAEAGYLSISLAGIADDDDVLVFPADETKIIEYTITNESDIPVIARFTAGVLSAYVMPSDYLEDGFVLDQYRKALKDMKPEEKIEDFIYRANTGLDAIADIILTADNEENDGWTMAGTGSEYLGKDVAGNHYFALASLGTAVCNFEIGLTEAADNQYQYALLSLDKATALATQDNDDAFFNTFNVVRSTVSK